MWSARVPSVVLVVARPTKDSSRRGSPRRRVRPGPGVVARVPASRPSRRTARRSGWSWNCSSPTPRASPSLTTPSLCTRRRNANAKRRKRPPPLRPLPAPTASCPTRTPSTTTTWRGSPRSWRRSTAPGRPTRAVRPGWTTATGGPATTRRTRSSTTRKRTTS
uniref:(northern house mosquito) hypothetical protein n=1 Tax=Culex pipiens TaxID=7175 RepID=A0A8D8J4J7_CULPI